MDNQQKVLLTYETIFDLVRREKSREDLQKIEPSFYSDVQNYLHEKTAALAGTNLPESVFAEEARIKLQRQVENIKLLLKELYERREKKILNIALIKSRAQSSVIDTSALLEEEKQLFTELANNLSSQRDALLHKLINNSHTNQQPQQMPNIQSTKTQPITFIHYVPKFVGRDLKVYGPYEPGEKVTIPTELAEILITKGRAKEESESSIQN